MGDKGQPLADAARFYRVDGRVQGVGFRPFVFRLAHRLGLRGWVQNRLGHVAIQAEGAPAALAAFERALLTEAPALAQPRLAEGRDTASDGAVDFRIRPSQADQHPHIHVPPDFFACEDCLRELHDPGDRRYRYPFINCTQCGPRYTLIRRLPYDRPNTSMAEFALCAVCRREYGDPLDRRFHAQPVACPRCGPQLQLAGGEQALTDPEAILAACVAALRAGETIAVKGVGGYHLLCDARERAAVASLRARKPRPAKPLAVLCPRRGADGLAAARELADLTPLTAAQLIDPMRPIVLCAKRDDGALAENVAPGLPEVGLMLPYSPLHELLLDDFGGPLVATSANLSGEPVLTEREAVEARLPRVATLRLHHDRPIERPADDSVYRPIAGRARPLRLGRGVAPLELNLPRRLAAPLLALGGHMKNTVALAWEDRVVVSPHIGDLDAPRSLEVFEQVGADLQRLYGIRAERLVCDAHPGYASTRWARRQGLPVLPVYHHRAHASALAGEFPGRGPWLVFTWDGVGYGEDGTLWGGEALLGEPGAWRRVASLRPFRLPGGERAGREPWRSALALCWETGHAWGGAPAGVDTLRAAWARGLNAPATSAAGRLFDAAAALTGVLHEASFEGQGPMLLEALSAPHAPAHELPLTSDAAGIWRLDWAPLLPMLSDAALCVAERGGRFHASLAGALLAIARRARAEHGALRIGLGGGVFQNRLLSEQAMGALEADGFGVFLGESLPANDGAIAFGQAVEAAALLAR